MEFLASELTEFDLHEHAAVLRDISRQLGLPVQDDFSSLRGNAAAAAGGETGSHALQTALEWHRNARVIAFTVKSSGRSAAAMRGASAAEASGATPSGGSDMVPYDGDVRTYVDGFLRSRVSKTTFDTCEIDVEGLFRRYPAKPLGAALKKEHFHLLSTHAFLNTGSYGATPRLVLDARAMWEDVEMTDPYSWRHTTLPFRMRQAKNRLAEFVGAHPADIQLFTNANTATSTVLKSLPWEVGDSLLLFSCDYDATKLAAEYLQAAYGVVPQYIDIVLPLSDDEIVSSLRTFLALQKRQKLPMPKLANFCHVTSKTAWIFPIKAMVDVCHQFGITVMVDGAQAAGHFPINIVDIGAEYYLGTVHKWMYSCQGVAFLAVAPSKQPVIAPLAPTVGHGEDYSRAFADSAAYDCCAFVALLQALDWVDRVCGGWAKVWRYNGELAQEAVRLLRDMWNLDADGVDCIQSSQVFPPQGSGGPVNCMPIVPLPKGRGGTQADATRLMGYLLARCSITAFLLVESFRYADGGIYPTLAVRLTAQVHVSLDDVRRLGKSVRDLQGTYNALEDDGANDESYVSETVVS